jgi:hypothetical protein
MRRKLKASVYQVSRLIRKARPMWVAELESDHYSVLGEDLRGKSIEDPNNALYDLRFEIFRRTGEIVDLYV